MAEVHEAELPGVGTGFDYRTGNGEHIAVIVHRSGTREVLASNRNDPDAFGTVLRLSADDTLTFVELLGASRVTMRLQMQHELEGLTIDWLTVAPDSWWAGRTLAEAAVHSRTGVSIVAILRERRTLPAPSADVTLQPGDRLVSVGRPDGVAQLERELAGS